jgi:hypothetical protein
VTEQPLNEFLVACATEFAGTPTVKDLAERIRRRARYDGPSSAEAVREGRDQR